MGYGTGRVYPESAQDNDEITKVVIQDGWQEPPQPHVGQANDRLPLPKQCHGCQLQPLGDLKLTDQKDGVRDFLKHYLNFVWPKKHDGPIEHMCWSPDGQKVATASGDKTCKIWNASSGSGTEKLTLQHTDWVCYVSWSPDGQQVATASSDKTCKIWDTSSGEEKLTLQHAHSVEHVSWSPDGQKVATASKDNTCKIWDALSGAKKLTLQHTDMVCHVSWSPDGQQVATASRDKMSKIWDASSGEEKLILQHTDMVRHLSWSPDGQQLATASLDFSCKIWDSSGTEKLTLQHALPVIQVSWSPDGQKVATASSDNICQIWDASSGAEELTLKHAETVRHVSWSPDGQKVATASEDTTCKIWDASSGTEKLSLQHTDGVQHVSWSPDGQKVATASSDNTCQIWDASSDTEQLILQHTDWVAHVSWSPDGKKMAATASHNNTCKIWDASSGAEKFTLQHTDPVMYVSWSPDGQKVATASRDTTCKIWDTLSGAKKLTLQHTAPVNHVSWSPDGHKLATASGVPGANACDIWDALSGADKFTLKHAGLVHHVSWSPDGQQMAASSDNTCKIWDASSGTEKLTLQHTEMVWHVSWSPDGQKVATASEDTTCKIWDASSGAEELTLKHAETVRHVSWSPDGQKVATASEDTTCKIWDALSGAKKLTLQHTDAVNDVSWSPDGQKVATASSDKTCKIWDASSGEGKLALQHAVEVHRVRWNPDGQKLATASHDNNCKIWTLSFLLPENQSVASACLWREKMLGAGDFPFNEVFFPGDLSVSGFSLFSWLRLIGLTQFLSEKLQKLDFSVLIRQALARFGPEILINSDALGNNCLDLATDNAIERQDHAEITTFLTSDILNAVASDMFRACKSGFVNSLDIAVSYLLEHQKLATLKDQGITFIDLLGDLTWTAKDAELRRADGAIDLHVASADAFHFAKTFRKENLPKGAGYEIEVTTEVFVLQPDHFFSLICNAKLPNKTKVFESTVMRALVAYKWKQWYRYFYAEFMYYIIFLTVYTVTTWYKVWEESSEMVVELQVAATALAIPISLREAVEICNGGSCKGLLKFWSVLALLMPWAVVLGFWFDALEPLQPYTALAAWSYLFYFLGGIEYTGAYISMLFEVVKDMKAFLVVLVAMLMALTHSFSLAAAGQRGQLLPNIMHKYRVGIMGDLGTFDNGLDAVETTEDEAAMYIFFFLTTMGITVAMLNLLIAVISDTYDRVREHMLSSMIEARALKVLEFEKFYGCFKRKPQRFLMWIRPANDEEFQDDWTGKIGKMQSVIQSEVVPIKKRLENMERLNMERMENMERLNMERLNMGERLQNMEALLQKIADRVAPNEDEAEDVGATESPDASEDPAAGWDPDASEDPEVSEGPDASEDPEADDFVFGGLVLDTAASEDPEEREDSK